MFEADTMNVAQGGGSSGAPAIFDANLQNFEDSVMKASMTVPVLVQIWSPRSPQCAQMLPLMEAAVQAAGGKASLAKVNIDENPQLGQMLQVRAVPTILAFFQGQPVDGLSGAQSQAQIQAFVEKVQGVARGAQPDAIDVAEVSKVAAEAVAAGNFPMAQAAYSQILQQDHKNIDAYIGLVRVFIAAGEVEQAQQLVDNAPPEMIADKKFVQAKTALEMAQSGGDVESLAKAVAKNSKDHAVRLDLARALFAAGQQEEAIDHVLESIKIDPKWNEDAARKQILQFFEALGASSPLVMQSRRKLSSLLFS